jgi:WD40 repeat protein
MNIQVLNKFTGHNGAIYKLIQHPDEQKIISAGGDGWVVEWNKDPKTKDGQLIAQVNEQVFAMACLPDTSILLLGSLQGSVFWVDITKKDSIKNMKFHTKSVYDIIVNDGFAYSVGGDGVLIKWDIYRMEAVISIQLSNQGLRKLAMHPDGKTLAIGSSDNGIYFVNKDSFEVKLRIPRAHDNSVFSLCFGSDYLLSGSRDALLKKWKLNLPEETKEVKSVNAHWFTINHIEALFPFPFIATASRDKSIRIWTTPDIDPLVTIDYSLGAHVNSVNSLYFDKHSQILYSAGDDRQIVLTQMDF